jgi:hypothetical protein
MERIGSAASLLKSVTDYVTRCCIEHLSLGRFRRSLNKWIKKIISFVANPLVYLIFCWVNIKYIRSYKEHYLFLANPFALAASEMANPPIISPHPIHSTIGLQYLVI